MVVDDEADLVDIIQRSLQKWDLFSDGFADPVRALEHFRGNSQHYVLVITDLKMPGMSGFQFIEQVTKIKPDIKVMIVTAYFRDMLAFPYVLKGIIKVNIAIQFAVSCSAFRRRGLEPSDLRRPSLSYQHPPKRLRLIDDFGLSGTGNYCAHELISSRLRLCGIAEILRLSVLFPSLSRSIISRSHSTLR